MQSSDQQLEGSDQIFFDPVPSLPPSDAQATENMGKLSLTDGHAVYMGSSHWATILEDVRLLYNSISSSLTRSRSNNSKTSCPTMIRTAP